MTDDLSTTIAAIHAAPQRLVFVFAGAGSQALWWLHAVAGSSRTVLEAVDCYAPRSLASLLGAPPAQAVSRETALAMARRAYERAMLLADDNWPLLGIACTAAIATNRTRRSENRAFVAVWGAAGAVTGDALTMARGARERIGEEELVSRLVIQVIARACAVVQPTLALLPGDLWIPGSTVDRGRSP